MESSEGGLGREQKKEENNREGSPGRALEYYLKKSLAELGFIFWMTRNRTQFSLGMRKLTFIPTSQRTHRQKRQQGAK